VVLPWHTCIQLLIIMAVAVLEAELPSQKRVKLDELMGSMMLGSSSGDANAAESAAARSRRRRRFVLFTTTEEDLVQVFPLHGDSVAKLCCVCRLSAPDQLQYIHLCS
jgi:hypothetical protein